MARLKTSESSMILIVADTSSNLGLLFDYLQGFGFRVLGVKDGESALDVAEKVMPDIILLDVILAGIDGFETCRQLKANQATQNIPVIFITALSNTIDVMRGFALGAVDYITKPLQSEEVLARLKTHLTIQSLQKRLAEKNARLEEEIAEREKLIAELDAFAHTVAHDLKNPLGVTMTHAQFLKLYIDKMSPEDAQKYSDIIVRNGHKMSNIIDELLLLSSVRTEEVALEPLEMGDIVAEVQHRLTYMIEEYEAEIIVPAEWPIVQGHGSWIEEVWINYVSNAIKYGGEPPQVELGATAQPDGMAQFWVRDNGDGLTPAAQAQLFIPFTRLNQVSAEGHGLGLSIVQRIMTRLGGKVGVESAGVPGRGAVFSFYLPQVIEESRPNGDEIDEG